MGLMSGALWGLSFLMPLVLKEIEPLTMALGRFLWYGFFSIIYLVFFVKKEENKNLFKEWKSLIFLSMIGYSAYYCFLTFSIQTIGVTLPTLFMGMVPLTSIILSRFFQQSPIPLKKILGSVSLSLVGVGGILISSGGAHFQFNLWGISAGLISLISWTFYSYLNSQKVRKLENRISIGAWTSGIGVFSALTIIGILCLQQLVFMFQNGNEISEILRESQARKQSLSPIYLEGENLNAWWSLAVQKYEYFKVAFILNNKMWAWGLPNNLFFRWLGGSFILGAFSSFLAIFCWNLASQSLKAEEVGQLIVSETVFGVIYGWLYSQIYPGTKEVFFVVLAIFGLSLTLQRLRKGRNDSL